MNTRPAVRNGARFYFSGALASGARVVLGMRIAHHLRVLRLQAGEPLVLFTGEGGEFDATLARIDKRDAIADIGAWHDVERESPLRLVLAQGISAAEKMDYTLQKAVELGVSAIQPLETANSVVRLDAERAQRRLVHWRQIVISACEQCSRNRVPEVAPLADLRAWLGTAKEGTRLLLSPRAQKRVVDLAPTLDLLVLLAGPEGGFTPQEEAAASAAGFTGLTLGPRILRTETAALAALAAIQAARGDG